MTVDISALAWLVRRMDVSATLKTFVAVFAVFLVLLAVLGKWAWKPILLGLQKREESLKN